MRVIAVDPGYDRLGVAVIEFQDGKEYLLYSGCIETNKNDSLPTRTHAAGAEFLELVRKYQPSALAIETLFFNKNQKTAIGVAGIRGMLMYIAQASHCSVFEFSPQEIKVAITGYGKSDKTAVIDMVRRLVQNAPKKALDDEYDAIAIGVTCLAHHGRTK